MRQLYDLPGCALPRHFSNSPSRCTLAQSMRAELETAVPVHFQARAPIAPLEEFVELLWYWSGDARNYGRERLLPMGQVELVIQVRNSRPYAAISGPRSEPFIIDRR